MDYVDADGGSMATVEEEMAVTITGLDDLPECCLSHVIALTSPRDACRCAAVSPSFRDAADSDAVWAQFLPPDYRAILLRSARRSPASPAPLPSSSSSSSKKDAYLRLSDSAVLVDDDHDDGSGGTAVWLEKGSGAKCVALSARKLSLPWEDGEFSWRWAPHPLSRFAEVAELVSCTELEVYGRLPAAALTPATEYAAYLVYGTAEGHRGLSYPGQETTVAVVVGGGGAASSCRHAVCLCPDDVDADADAEARKFRGVDDDVSSGVRRPARRDDGWWEVEMGRVRVVGEASATVAAAEAAEEEEEVAVSFEVLGWYPKRGLIVEGVEFRPV